MEYIRVAPDQCKQIEGGRIGTPCYQDMRRVGVDCGLMCPIDLATATDRGKVWTMLHDGTCFLDERNPLGQMAYFKALAKGRAIVVPEP